MKLIIGLGNPGEKYEQTRHNIGFRVLERIVEEKGLSFHFDKKFDVEVGESSEAKFVRPQTFMNESGRAVQKCQDFWKIDDEDIIVIHDDVDLELGKVKIVFGGSSAGHKGVESIIHHLGTEHFWRVRVGVGRSDQIPTEDWVLMNFSSGEKEMVDKIIDETAGHMIELLNNSIENETISIE